MTDLRKAAQQALEALEELDGLDTETECVTIDVGDVITALTAALEQQAEPVAWMDREGDLYKIPEIENWAPPHTMLYTTPPQRQWVGLTDEDWAKVADMPDTFDQGVAWAAARLKEKNSD